MIAAGYLKAYTWCMSPLYASAPTPTSASTPTHATHISIPTPGQKRLIGILKNN